MAKNKSKLYRKDRLEELPKAFKRFFALSGVNPQNIVAVLGGVKLGGFEDSVYLTDTYVEQITMKRFTKVPRYNLADITAVYPDNKGLLRDIVVVLGGSNTVKLSTYSSPEEAQSMCDIINETRQVIQKVAPVASTTSAADDLKKYHDLFTSGAISEEEYSVIKEKLIAKL